MRLAVGRFVRPDQRHAIRLHGEMPRRGRSHHSGPDDDIFEIRHVMLRISFASDYSMPGRTGIAFRNLTSNANRPQPASNACTLPQ